MVIDGRTIAQKIIDELKKQPKPKKFLAAFLIGEDLSSVSFIKQKEKVAKELGIDFRIYRRPTSIDGDELRKEVLKIALHKTCGGVIVQLPLPEHINKHYILNVVPREKDVDVLGERALGAFYAGRNPVLPPAVGTVEKILRISNFQFPISKVAVVGLGLLVGKPIAHWFMARVAELYLLSRGSDFSILKQADLVISGVGEAGIIKPDMLKPGVGVIDFGYSIAHGKISGDLDTSRLEIVSLREISRRERNWKLEISFYTPTPGGTGPILVAQLFENFYRLGKGQKLSEFDFV